MVGDAQLQERLAWIARITLSPPVVHPEAINGAVWSTETTCYEFMAHHVHEGSRTLETGAGLSTALFAAWGCDHLSVMPFKNEADAIIDYCSAMGIDSDSCRFDVRPSQIALPELPGTTELDLVFVDGCHGFPMPIIDWFYGAGLLRKGGVVVFDDVQLPQVRWLIDTFIDRDHRWELLASTWKWMAYRRVSEGTLVEGELNQLFFPEPPRPLVRRAKDLVPLNVKRSLRRLLGMT
jgi:Methyltransferase domain